jgi:hypothetical protein
MRKLAIFLLVASPILAVIGMAGCVASIASIGNTSRQMTPFEAFGLLGAPILFVVGVVLLIVDWRRRRRMAVDGGRPGIHKPIAREPGGVVGAAVSITQIVVGSSAIAIGWGLLGLALNTAFLIWAAKGLKNTLESGSIARYIAAALMCLLACMPVGYAILAWKVSIRRRLGQALKPYEDKIMEALARIVTEYVTTRAAGSAHAATLAACIERAPDMPAPVRFVLKRLVHRFGVSETLEAGIRSHTEQGVGWGVVVQPAITLMRAKLDAFAFKSGRAWIVYLLGMNIAFYVLLVVIMGFSPDGVASGVEGVVAVLVGGPLLVYFYLYGPPRLINTVKNFWNTVVHVFVLVVTIITGVRLLDRRRSPVVRWTGYVLLVMVYGGLNALACVMVCYKFKDEQSHLIVPVFWAVVLVPAWILMRWVRRSGPEPAGKGT